MSDPLKFVNYFDYSLAPSKIDLGTSGTAQTLTAGTPLHALYSTCSSTSTSTAAEPFYMKSTMTGAAGIGGRARFHLYTNVALGSYSNALKGYTEYGASGRTTGLGSAVCAEILLSAGTSSGTYAPLESEIVINTGGSTGTATSFLYCNATGTAAATFDSNGYFFQIGSGITAGSGKMLYNNTLKVLIEATTWYLALSSAEDSYAAQNAAGPIILNEAATTTNPTLIPNRVDETTGIGWNTAELHFVISGVDEVNLSAAALSPGVTDSTALGTTALMWSDLFLASGAVINFNNGDVTLTHSTDHLLVEGGWLRLTRTFTTVSGNNYSLRADSYPTLVSGASAIAVMGIAECLAGTGGVNAIGGNFIGEMDSTKRITGFLTAVTASLINGADAMGGMGCVEMTWKNTATAPSAPGSANHAYMIMRDYSTGGGTVCCSLFWFGDITVGSASASALICENGSAGTASHVIRFMVGNTPYWILCDDTPPA